MRKLKKKDLKSVNDPCSDVCHLAYDLARKEGANHETAEKVADIAYANCIKSRKGLSQEAAISQ
jgi:hypothetical protein